jgi:5-formyltetrahydrofolate cyclo-ligase
VDPETIADRKRAIRREMRALRRALPDQAERSSSVWSQVQALPAVVAARVVMAYTSVPGEPDTAPFISWCETAGKQVVFPESEPSPDPAIVDVVVVPGTAFTLDGHRLGQGGGWYDRFLARLGPRCTKIGVGFSPQLVDSLPVEEHDVQLDLVVTDQATVQAPRTR